MSIISFAFQNSKEIFQTKDAKEIIIHEKESARPQLNAVFPLKFFQNIEKKSQCKMFIETTLVFCGTINSIVCSASDCLISVLADPLDTSLPKIEHEKFEKTGKDEQQDNANDFMKIFSDESKAFFSTLEISQQTKTGEIKNISMLNPYDVLHIEDIAIADSFKIEEAKNEAVSTLDLEILSSWVKNIEESQKIDIKNNTDFNHRQIHTLTPNKLLDSWPAKFQKILKTKYLIETSKLTQISQSQTEEIQIDGEIFSLQKTSFAPELEISWYFDQFINESFKAKIVNKLNQNGIAKKISLNLNNVQEYIHSQEEKSFVASETGQKILQHIYKMIGNYITLSMRNIKISCDLAYNGDEQIFSKLGAEKWIAIKNHVAKISEIKYILSNKKKIIKIQALAFPKEFTIPKTLLPPEIKHSQEFQQCNMDLNDISIENEADEQFSNLCSHIDMLKAQKQINKNNYKKIISDFLNANSTKIHITLPPLKIQHAEKQEITIEQVQYFGI